MDARPTRAFLEEIAAALPTGWRVSPDEAGPDGWILVNTDNESERRRHTTRAITPEKVTAICPL